MASDTTTDTARTLPALCERVQALEAALQGLAARPPERCTWCGGMLTAGWWTTTTDDDSGIEHHPDCPAAIAATALRGG